MRPQAPVKQVCGQRVLDALALEPQLAGAHPLPGVRQQSGQDGCAEVAVHGPPAPDGSCRGAWSSPASALSR